MNIKKTMKQLDKIPLPPKSTVMDCPDTANSEFVTITPAFQSIKTNNLRVLTVGLAAFTLIIGGLALWLSFGGLSEEFNVFGPGDDTVRHENTQAPKIDENNTSNPDYTTAACFNCFYSQPGGACLFPEECAGISTPPFAGASCRQLPCGCPCKCPPQTGSPEDMVCYRMYCVYCEEPPSSECLSCDAEDCDGCFNPFGCGCYFPGCKRDPESSYNPAWLYIETEFFEYDKNTNIIRFDIVNDSDYCGGFGLPFKLKRLHEQINAEPEWITVPFNSDVAWNSIAILSPPNSRQADSFRIADYFAPLPPGTYLICKCENFPCNESFISNTFVVK
jgi:hypothetical protein